MPRVRFGLAVGSQRDWLDNGPMLDTPPKLAGELVDGLGLVCGQGAVVKLAGVDWLDGFDVVRVAEPGKHE